jgi:hypothetical protein
MTTLKEHHALSDDDDTQTLGDESEYQFHKKWAIPKTPGSLISTDARRRLECLAYDMQTCSRNIQAQERLNKAKAHPYYLGPPYISVPLGLELLKSRWRHKDNDLRGHLEKTTILNGGHYGPSTLGPVLESYLQIGTEFEENETFRNYYRRFCEASEMGKEDESIHEGDVSK